MRDRLSSRRRAHLLGGVTLGVIATLAALTAAIGMAAHPAAYIPWMGPTPEGVWVRTTLTLQTNALLAQPSHPGVLVAGTNDGVWRSVDGGVHWVHAGSGLRGNAIVALAAAPGQDTVFAGSTDGAVYASDVRRDGLWGPWRRVSPSLDATPVFSLAISPERRGTVLAGTIGALYRGVAGGRGWLWSRVVRTGEAAVTSIIWSPTDAASALAAVFGVWPPVLATRDGGRTWRAAATGLPSLLPTQALLASRGGQVILTTMGGGVWERSASGPWRDISAGLPARHAMPMVALPGSGATVLYAGTMGYGVYVKQGSAAWRQLGHGLMGGANTILALAMTAGPESAAGAPSLFAATAGGVFRYVARAGHGA